jgi:deoxyribodipyrimidine photo-lyase
MLQVVWLKRYLRIFDHAPLAQAAAAGPVLIIYPLEPSIWQAGDLSKRHLAFVIESLKALDFELAKRGAHILYTVAEMDEVLDAIFDAYGAFRLLAHEENGTPWTYARDKRVHRWMKARGLEFHEVQQFGVTRRLTSRSRFNELWRAYIEQPIIPAPTQFEMGTVVPAGFGRDLRAFAQVAIPGDWVRADLAQRGGEHEAHKQLKRFLGGTYRDYLGSISSPSKAEQKGSRLSPYLAWGNLSLRYVVMQSEAVLDRGVERWAQKSMLAFLSRCHWHCHFIQRIEDEPEIAVRTINPAFDAIRTEWDEVAFQRWATGTTGVPLIDAGMRALHETGWVNFRMRAILLSFVCNTLMLDWRRPAEHLARLFLDYEPGIHYSQVQMQAGVTGFNTIRIYNPLKQAEDHDPDGAFVRKYGPIQPLEPMVDVEQANRVARDLLWGVKRQSDTRHHAQQALEKHGSRKTMRPKPPKLQVEFEFDD